ncbi:MAG: glycosyltransferase family 4 protein [Frankiaceae bacterium]
MTRQEIIFIVRSWPRLSQTFVLDEILGLERLGLPMHIVALTAAHEAVVQAEVSSVQAPVDYLSERPERIRVVADHVRQALVAPVRYLRAVALALGRGERDEGYQTASRGQRLTMAVRLAALTRAHSRGDGAVPVHLHAHFAHDPAAVAMLAHLLTGLPWSFTGHARDLWQVAPAALAERVASAQFTVTCSRAGADHVRALTPAGRQSRIRLIHHGVDVERYLPGPAHQPAGPRLSIVSVGRLVEKKGFADLLEALRLLVDRGYAPTCTIYGEGPLHDSLTERAGQLGLSTIVTFAGVRSREELLPLLQRADVFALTPYVTADGDRDGIPNVIVEAMACALPVVATSEAGVPEIVVDGLNGLLADPRDASGVADRLAAVADDAALRARLGAEARRTVLAGFDARDRARELAALFEPALDGLRQGVGHDVDGNPDTTRAP